MQKPNIAFIGAGNMASAIIGGLVSNGYEAKNIWASDPFEASLKKLNETYGINTNSNNNEALEHADIVVLAVKPQIFDTVCKDIQSKVAEKSPLIISIAAGITVSMMESWLDDKLSIIRCMPNTPALVQTGATGAYANQHVSATQQSLAEDILNAIGLSCWVDSESQLDAVTAVSGSGPAYFFYMMEAMQAAGEELGLPAEIAKKLTLQTALGAAKMAIDSDVDADELRRRVTSPNGTTEAAINTFDAENMSQAIKKALYAADKRSKSLAEEMQQATEN